MELDPKIKASLIDICTRSGKYVKEVQKEVFLCRTKNYEIVLDFNNLKLDLQNITQKTAETIDMKNIKDVKWIASDVVKIKTDKGEIIIEL